MEVWVDAGVPDEGVGAVLKRETVMNLEKFTERSRGVLQAAQTIDRKSVV